METGAMTKTAATTAAPTKATMELKNRLFFFISSLLRLAATQPDSVVFKVGMALVFEQRRILVRVAMQVHANRPRPGKRLRIGHGGFVLHHVGAGARVALHHFQRGAVMIPGGVKPSLIVEIGDVHHQRVSVPMAA